VVEPAGEVDGVADEVEKERDLVDGPAHDEATAHHQRRHDSVAPGRVTHRVTFERRLNRHRYQLLSHAIIIIIIKVAHTRLPSVGFRS